MDPLRPALTRRERRQAASKKAPYSRPEGNQSNSLTSRKKTHTPYWRKRVARFLNPWRQDTDEEDEGSVEPAEENAREQASSDQQMAEQEDGRSEHADMERDTTFVEDTVEIIEEKETLDMQEVTPSVPTDSSLATLVETSFEMAVIPEINVIANDEEDQDEQKQRQEREESVVSGQDSDAVPDRKEARSSRFKRDSRSSTPVRSTRRTTRSQAAKTDDAPSPAEKVSVVEEEPVVQYPELELVSEPTEQSPEESSSTGDQTVQDTTPTEEQAEPTKVKGNKKKKKGKKRSKKGEVEAPVDEQEKETPQSDDRITEKIRETDALIEESEQLLRETTSLGSLDRDIAHTLDSKDPFSDQNADQMEMEMEMEVVEDDDQTFHSTIQFEPMDNDDEEKEPRYPVIDYDELKYAADDESADTVKYYPPDSPRHEKPGVLGTEDHRVDEDQEVNHAQQDVQVESLENTYDMDTYDDSEQSPSPPAAEPVLLLDSDDIEFSPMQTPTSTPPPEASTPSSKEHFVDCAPIVTPRAERIKRRDSSSAPFPNTDISSFLANFFDMQKGKLLTRNQALACHRLIEEAVVGPKDITWLDGEDGVSFRNQSAPPRQGTPVQPMLAESSESVDASNMLSCPVRLSATSGTTSSGPSPAVAQKPRASISVREVRPVVPYEVKRRAVSDLRDEAPKQPLLPPLEEYLEIEKYAGVEWDDLPKIVQTRRLIMWGDTEAPEAIKRRKIEEKEKMRKKNAEIWAKEKEAKEQEVKKQEAKENKVAEDSAMAVKRKASRSGMFSDSEDESDLHKKSQVSKPKQTVSSNDVLDGVAPVAAAATVAVEQDLDKASEKGVEVSSVAQKILDIIGKGPAVDDEETAFSKENTTVSAKPSAPVCSKPFVFLPTTTTATTATTTAIAQEKKEPAESVAPSTGGLSFVNPTATTASESGPTAPTFKFGSVASGTGNIFATPATAKPCDSSKPSLPTFSFSQPKSDADASPKRTLPTFSFASPAVAKPSPSGTSPSSSTSPFAKPRTGPLFTMPSMGSSSSEESSSSPLSAKASTSSFAAATAPTSSPFGKAPTGSLFSVAPAATKDAIQSNPSPWGTPSAISFGLPATPASPSESKTGPSPITFSFKSSSSVQYSEPQPAKSVFGFSATTSSGASTGFGQPSTSLSFGPSQPAASVNPFAAFMAGSGSSAPLGKDEKKEPTSGVIVLSDGDDEDDEDRDYDQQQEEDEEQDENEKYYGDENDEDEENDGYYDENEEEDGQGSYELDEEYDLEDEGSFISKETGSDRDDGDSGSFNTSSSTPMDSPRRLTTRADDGQTSAFGQSSGFKFGERNTTFASGGQGFGNGTSGNKPATSGFSFLSTSTTTTSSSLFGQPPLSNPQPLKTPEFSFNFGEEPRLPVDHPSSPTLATRRVSASSGFSSFGQSTTTSTVTATTTSTSAFGAFGSSGSTGIGIGLAGPTFSFGSSAQDDVPKQGQLLGGNEEEQRSSRLARGSISEYEISPLMYEEEDDIIESGSASPMSPMSSPALTPRASF
ncbi:hypothetical protein BGX28_002102 [Mortierella sp. GBA30]|nr:hypothetical protein BGX28_002102 [Mortierella sp. GBA30]